MKVWIETDDLVELLNAQAQRDALNNRIENLNELIRNGRAENERLIGELNKIRQLNREILNRKICNDVNQDKPSEVNNGIEIK